MQTKCVWCIGFYVVVFSLTYHTTCTQTHVCAELFRIHEISFSIRKYSGLHIDRIHFVEICFHTWVIRDSYMSDGKSHRHEECFWNDKIQFLHSWHGWRRKFVCFFVLNQILIKKLSATYLKYFECCPTFTNEHGIDGMGISFSALYEPRTTNRFGSMTWQVVHWIT